MTRGCLLAGLGDYPPSLVGGTSDREFDRELQQVGVEEDFVIIDAADGVAVEAATLRSGIN
jgi:hypothetical protein